MGNKSNPKKFVGELPVLFAHLGNVLPSDFDLVDPSTYLDTSKMSAPLEMLESIRSRLPVALEKGKPMFLKNFDSAKLHLNKVFDLLLVKGLTIPNKIYWQPTEKGTGNPDEPSDIVWIDHPWGGVSVKTGGPNGFNLGTEPYRFGQSHGDDLFEHLVPTAWQAHWGKVKSDLYGVLNRVGYCDLSSKTTKRVITLDSDVIKIEVDSKLSWQGSVEAWLKHSEPKGARRVTGTYFQKNKKKYSTTALALTDALTPILIPTHQKCVNENKAVAGYHAGLVTKPYVFLDLAKASTCFLVPSVSEREVSVESIPFTKPFGSGYKIKCNVTVNGKVATVESYIRYHVGTFAGAPQNMIQNLKGKEQIWTQII
jgi:hypothetical protein